MGMESRAISQRTVARQDNAPADTELLWVDTSGTNPVLKQYYPESSEWGKVVQTKSGPNPYDAAQSFTETDLTLTNPVSRVTNGSVELDPFSEGTTATLPDTARNRSEIFVPWVPKRDLSAVDVEWAISVTDPEVVRRSDGTVVGTDTGSYSDGEVSRIEADATYTEGTPYEINVASSSGSWNTSNFASSYSSSQLGSDDITFQSVDDLITAARNIQAVYPAKSDTLLLEWPFPPDLYEWDVATFTRSQDGETADVYVAYDDGTGWERANSGGPINRNYSLSDDTSIAPSDDVRIEVELARSDTANNPTLDSAYRSWRV